MQINSLQHLLCLGAVVQPGPAVSTDGVLLRSNAEYDIIQAIEDARRCSKHPWRGQAEKELDMGSIPQKRCAKCGAFKDSSSFPPSKKSPDGLFSYCRDCRKVYDAARRAGDPERYREQFAKWRAANLEHDRERNRRYIAEHREERREYSRKYADEHPEQVIAATRRWQKARPDLHRANAVRYRSRNPQKARAVIYAWKHRNPDRVREMRRNYRARKNGALGHFTDQEWRDLCAQYGNVCLACGSSAPLTADHVVPLTRGGSDTIDNIQPLCAVCNSKKRARIIDYRPSYG